MKLILLVCSALGCHERTIPVYGPVACQLAQAEIARLLLPGEHVERWRCE